ncbi:hypothetical protein D9M69_462750 [compost metagenome]
MPQRHFVGHDRALAETHQVNFLRFGVIFLRGLCDEIQQHLTAGFQIIGLAVVGPFALLAKPLVAARLHHQGCPHRQVGVGRGQVILDAEQVLLVTAVTVEENHQGLMVRIGVGLLQILERQVGLQRGLGVDSGGYQEREQRENLQHGSSFTECRIRARA